MKVDLNKVTRVIVIDKDGNRITGSILSAQLNSSGNSNTFTIKLD